MASCNSDPSRYLETHLLNTKKVFLKEKRASTYLSPSLAANSHSHSFLPKWEQWWDYGKTPAVVRVPGRKGKSRPTGSTCDIFSPPAPPDYHISLWCREPEHQGGPRPAPAQYLYRSDCSPNITLDFNNKLSTLTWRWSGSSSRCPSHPLESPPQCSQWGPRYTACRLPASLQWPRSRRWPGHMVYILLPWLRICLAL